LEDKGQVGIEAGAHSEIRLTLGTSFGIGDNFDADFYFSGLSIYAKINFGRKKSKKPKTFDIMPDFSKTFNILKNKGEYK
ncbi:MAG: hypothetical protein JKY08_08055, partial [Flavobacteriaceae bacterium]|nr:hypothetical protein [Flavobacteriaceae bacterium]